MSDAKTLTRQEHIAILVKLYGIVTERLKLIDGELAAHRIAFDLTKAALLQEGFLPQGGHFLDEALAAARRSPALHESLKRTYDIPLERFRALDAKFQTEEKLWELFSNNSTDLIQ